MGKQTKFPTPYAVTRFIRHGVTPRGFGLFSGVALGSLAVAVLAVVAFFVMTDYGRPKHPDAVLRVAAKVLSATANVSVTVDLLKPGEYLGERFDAYERELRREGIGTTKPAPILPPRQGLSHVIISNYPPSNQLYVGYVPTAAVYGMNRQIRPGFMSSLNRKTMPGFVVPFSMSADSAVTLAGVASMFDAFVRGNTGQFPGMTTSQLMFETRRQLTGPPGRNLPRRAQVFVLGLMMIGLTAIRMVAMTVYIYLGLVKRSLMPAWVEYGRRLELGFELPRPSAWQCFFSESHQAYTDRYVSFLNRTVADFQRQQREERRNLSRAEELTKAMEEFDQQAETVSRELEGQGDLPIQVVDDQKLMEDPLQPLEVRRMAAARIRAFLAMRQLPPVTIDSTSTAPVARPKIDLAPDEELLLEKALAIDPMSWPEDQRRELERWFAEYDVHQDDETPDARIAALTGALALAKQVRQELGAKQSQSARPVVQRRTIEDLAAGFTVAKWLSPRIDHDHVVAILIWGLVKPGRGLAMFTGRRSAQVEQLRSAVVCKLGVDYDAAVYETALHWLVQHGVVNQSRKKGRETYSLNFGSASTDAGTKIVQSIKQFTFSVREDLSRV